LGGSARRNRYIRYCLFPQQIAIRCLALALAALAALTRGCDAVDVRVLIAHDVVHVATQIGHPDIVAKDDENAVLSATGARRDAQNGLT
jgi:hypothetical protein